MKFTVLVATAVAARRVAARNLIHLRNTEAAEWKTPYVRDSGVFTGMIYA